MVAVRKRTQIGIMVVLICIFSSGCSSFKRGVIFETPRDSELDRDERIEVSPGLKIKVVLWNGQEFDGTATSVSTDKLIINKASNYGNSEVELAVGDIKEILVEDNSNGWIVAAVAVGVTVVVLAVLNSFESGLENGLGSLEKIGLK